MSFTKTNYGLTFSLLILLGLLICCNLDKFLHRNSSEKFLNNTPTTTQNTEIPTTTFNPDNYYCPHLQQTQKNNSSRNSNNNIDPVYCPGEHPNIPCQLVKRCNCNN